MPPQLDRDPHGLFPHQHFSSTHFHQLFPLHVMSAFFYHGFPSCSSMLQVLLLWQSSCSALSPHFLSVCCYSLKSQMELYSCIWKDLQPNVLRFSTLPLEFSTTGCIYYTLGGVVHRVIKDVHLGGQIYSMH